jgi:hypothetical protein
MDKTYNAEMLARVSHAVINRLNFPKREARAMRPSQMRGRVVIDQHGKPKRKYAGNRPLLSHWDCEEVRQTCALVLSASGAIYRDKLQIGDWLAMFRASRAILRIDRKFHEDSTDFSTMHDLPVSVQEPLRFTVRRNVIARQIRYRRTCILAAFQADKSRQRKHKLRKSRAFLRYLASNASAQGIGHAEVSTAQNQRDVLAAFRRYCDAGERILERQAQGDVTARNARQAIDARGTVKTFAAITYKRGKRVALAA